MERRYFYEEAVVVSGFHNADWNVLCIKFGKNCYPNKSE